jgi:hypothetical protein
MTHQQQSALKHHLQLKCTQTLRPTTPRSIDSLIAVFFVVVAQLPLYCATTLIAHIEKEE